MTVRPKRSRLWLVAFLATCVGLLLIGSASTNLSAKTANSRAARAQTCANRANNTPQQLTACVTKGDLWSYMTAFQRIAIANPGLDGHPSRNSGEPGYLANVKYVAGLMKAAGYKVTIQRYQFVYNAFKGTPVFKETLPTKRAFPLGSNWFPGLFGFGRAINKAVQPVNGIVIRPGPQASSSSGCSTADFKGFRKGDVALIQRGTCPFGVKALNAKRAGASGVIIFNDGSNGDTAPIVRRLVDNNGNYLTLSIPVIAGASYSLGMSLLNQYQQAQLGKARPPVVTLNMPGVIDRHRPDYNLIADSRKGNSHHILVVDAHLDAIGGEGMLDNGSGSASILDIALLMKNANPTNKVRFIWFGGEELGLFGSRYYVSHLSPSARKDIKYDIDADVTATPNYVVGVVDPALTSDASRFPAGVFIPSRLGRNALTKYFTSIHLNHEYFGSDGTDAHSFNAVGIPASGVLTGQDCCKSSQEVKLFGGSVGNFEGKLKSFNGGCVDHFFQWCDNLNNNDPKVLTFMTKGLASAIAQLAFNRRLP